MKGQTPVDSDRRPVRPTPAEYRLFGLRANFDVDAYIKYKNDRNDKIEKNTLIVSLIFSYIFFRNYLQSEGVFGNESKFISQLFPQPFPVISTKYVDSPAASTFSIPAVPAVTATIAIAMIEAIAIDMLSSFFIYFRLNYVLLKEAFKG